MWKEIKGFSRYEVSDTGEVRNKETGEIVEQSTADNGTKIIENMINDNGESKPQCVHRLVAISFFDRTKRRAFCVRFIDGDRSNMTPENLEWCTRSQLLQAENTLKLPEVKNQLKNRRKWNQKIKS